MKHSKGKIAYILLLRRRSAIALAVVTGYGVFEISADLTRLVFGG